MNIFEVLLDRTKKFSKKMKWQLILSSLFAIIAGIFCIISPQAVWIFVMSIIFILFAIVPVVRSFGMGDIFDVIFSLIFAMFAICICILCAYNSALAQRLALVLLGLFLIIDSGVKLFYGVSLTRVEVKGAFWYFILAVLTFILGFIVMFVSFESFMLFCGIVLIVNGVIDIINTLYYGAKIKKFGKKIKNYYSSGKYNLSVDEIKDRFNQSEQFNDNDESAQTIIIDDDIKD